MGNNHIKQHQNVVNTVLQSSESSCTISCQNSIDDVTIIVEGGSGDITIDQECKMDNLNCILKSSFNTQIQDILKSMIDQENSVSGLTNLPWDQISQNVDLYQYIENSITQMMDNSCKFNAGNDASGIYMYVKDRKGNINLSQSASITNASCNMSSIAKAVVYNNESTKTKQAQEITGIFAMIVSCVIIGIIMLGIVLIVFFISGGASEIAGIVTASKSNKKSLLSEGEGALGSLADVVAADPELLALA